MLWFAAGASFGATLGFLTAALVAAGRDR